MKHFSLLSFADQEHRGILSRPGILNRIAPVFLHPRPKKDLHIKGLGLTGTQLMIPMGTGNWQSLSDRNKISMAAKARQVALDKLETPNILVSRGGTEQELMEPGDRNGDYFVSALTSKLAGHWLEKADAKRVIVAGDDTLTAVAALLIADRYRIPVIWQSLHPEKHEVTVSRALYRHGIPISLMPFDPAGWKKTDLALNLHEYYAQMGARYGSGCKVDLSNSSSGHAPELENELSEQGINPSLAYLSPVLEWVLLDDRDTTGLSEWEIVHDAEQKGDAVWDYFLDN
ncbi:MAG: hypothetical protein ACM3UZ_12860 [Acidobacteriota bacterium]